MAARLLTFGIKMNKNDKWLMSAQTCCAELGPEDGVDPRLLNKEKWKSKKSSHVDCRKQGQLCKQVERTIALFFAGESLQQALNDLSTRDVELMPNGKTFSVVLLIPTEMSHEELADVVDALSRVRGLIRSVVAQTIHRKRAPAIQFRIARVETPFYCEMEI